MKLFILTLLLSLTHPSPAIAKADGVDQSSREQVILAARALKGPELDSTNIKSWNDIIEYACRNDDDEVAILIVDKSRFKLDGATSMMYVHHLFNFLSKNPRVFFRNAIKTFGSITAIAEFFIDETETVTPDKLKKALENTPKPKQDQKNSTALIKEAKKVQSRLAASYRNLHR